MSVITVVYLVFILVLSAGYSALYFTLQRTRKLQELLKAGHKSELEALEKKLAKPVPEITAQEILHDLSRGGTLLRISRVDPSDVYLRSPRESA